MSSTIEHSKSMKRRLKTMRLSLKVAITILVSVFIYQFYVSFNFFLKPAPVFSDREECSRRFSDSKLLRFFYSQQENVTSLKSQNSSSTSPSNDGAFSLLRKIGDMVIFNSRERSPRSSSAGSPRTVSALKENDTASVASESGIRDTVKALLSDLTRNDLQQVFNRCVKAYAEDSVCAGIPGGPDGPGGAGVTVREAGKALLLSGPGKVKLPIVMAPSSAAREALPTCPDSPPKPAESLLPAPGPDHVPLTPKGVDLRPANVSLLEKRFSLLAPGGDYRPPDCRPRQRVAILIPYRNRWDHLHVLLDHLLPFLVRQQSSFTIFVIEQEPPTKFNRALMLNVGVLEASLRDLYTCFILHDVDLIPLDDRNLYRCSDQPKHLSVGISKFGFRLPYAGYFGGVSALSRQQLEKINGISNLYFGWGGEDDNLYIRVKARGMKVVRDRAQIGRYTMFTHKRDSGNEPNPLRQRMLKSTEKEMDMDGLNTLQYNVTSVQTKRLYTWIKVKVDPQQLCRLEVCSQDDWRKTVET